MPTVDYAVTIDTAALIQLTNESSVIYIDPSAHSAVYTGRTFTTANVSGREIPMIFTKMCKGLYLTWDEFKALRSEKAKSSGTGAKNPSKQPIKAR